MAEATIEAKDLKEQWERFRLDNPKVRIRDAARQLGVSEGELLATSCGDGVVRLAGDWGAMLRELHRLGHVMALTRNEYAVHERKGIYDNVTIEGPMGMALNNEIDLRLFMRHFHHGFAVTEGAGSDVRRSFQFFDADGTAIHKVYAQPDGDANAFDAITREFASDDQSRDLRVSQPELPGAELPDDQVDTVGFLEGWRGLQNTHDFVRLLRTFNVRRTQALRLAGDEFAYTVANDAVRTVLESARAGAVPIMIFVQSPGVVQIHSGTVERLVGTDGWYNVLDPGFNLHLREDGIASSWIVRKPTTDGIVTSLELYDSAGDTILIIFGSRKETIQEAPAWREIVEGLPRLDDPA